MLNHLCHHTEGCLGGGSEGSGREDGKDRSQRRGPTEVGTERKAKGGDVEEDEGKGTEGVVRDKRWVRGD